MPALADPTTCNAERVEPKLADYRYNLDTFNRAMRVWRIETAPADLSTLSDTDLKALDYACGGHWYETADRPALELLHRRVLAERAARGLNTPFDRVAA